MFISQIFFYMILQIGFGFSIALAVIASVVVVLAIWFEYWRGVSVAQLNKNQRIVLSVCRLLTFLMVVLLLLGFSFKKRSNIQHHPIIIYAQDNSQSVLATSDSSVYKNLVFNKIEESVDALSKKYEVKKVAFGDRVEVDALNKFNHTSTNFANLFEWIQSNYYGQNVGALIVATDGIVNQGADPMLASQTIAYPIYTIALGDTTPQSDIAIATLDYNRVCFQDVSFPISVGVKWHNVPMRNYAVRLFENGQQIAKQLVNVSQNNSFSKVVFQTKTAELGVHHYTIAVDTPSVDVNVANNKRHVVIDVKNEVQNVLFLQSGPHPDASAFVQAMRKSQRFNITVTNPNKIPLPITDYSLVVLHQLPSAKFNIESIINQTKNTNIPILLIIGDLTDVAQLSKLNLGVDIQQIRKEYDNAFPVQNTYFNWFNVGFESYQTDVLPPLHVPYGNYAEVPDNQVLFYQKISGVQTKRPLVWLQQSANQKIGVIAGEGMWRWRLEEFSKSANHDATNELISKLLQYLCNRDQKERFSLNIATQYTTFANVVADAQLLNQSFEPVSDAQIDMQIIDNDGVVLTTEFVATDNGFHLNAGRKQAGEYKYVATAKIGTEQLVRRGKFVVVDELVEMGNLQANHNLLFQLSTESGGKMFSVDSIEFIQQAIESNNNIVTTSSSVITNSPIISQTWLLGLILLLLAVEWFLRKLWGCV